MESLEIFDEWTTYEKVVANDHMHHRRFFAALTEHISDQFDRPISVLDVGCGDAKPVLNAFGRLNVERYVGIDQSSTALARAAESLESRSVSHELHEGTMLAELEKLDGKFDVVIGSFAFHHLEQFEKLKLLVECRRLLNPDGVVGIVDIFRDEHETLNHYQTRWERNARASFTSLAESELDELVSHMRECDRPESVPTYGLLAIKAGFAHTEVIESDAVGLNSVVVISGVRQDVTNGF